MRFLNYSQLFKSDIKSPAYLYHKCLHIRVPLSIFTKWKTGVVSKGKLFAGCCLFPQLVPPVFNKRQRKRVTLKQRFLLKKTPTYRFARNEHRNLISQQYTFCKLIRTKSGFIRNPHPIQILGATPTRRQVLSAVAVYNSRKTTDRA